MTSQQSANIRHGQAVTPAGGTPIDLRAQAIYRELRNSGFSDADVMAFAGELLSLVATDVRSAAAAE